MRMKLNFRMVSSSLMRAYFLEKDPEEGLQIYKQIQLEKGREGVTLSPSANKSAQKLMQCVLSARFQSVLSGEHLL